MEKSTMIGYHGTTLSDAESILKDGYFKHSTRNNDWLGTGAYFFAYENHAKQWIKHRRFRGKKTQILKATLEYTSEQMLDLDDPETRRQINHVVKTAFKKVNVTEVKGAAVDLESLDAPRRWCAICNFYRKLNTDIGITVYTFPMDKTGVSGYQENQRQICVSNDSIVAGIHER